MTITFPRLQAADIDVRVGTCSKNKPCASFLLYKDARCDRRYLNQVVGPCNWQRDHKEIKGNLYCGVAIRDTDTNEWIWKWDCGTESNTEKEKGEASDSFKRACFNWGIGEELYDAPTIWIDLTEKEYNGGKPFVHFTVTEMEYDEQARAFSKLTIVDDKLAVRYSLGKRVKAPVSGDSTAEGGKTYGDRVRAAATAANTAKQTDTRFPAGISTEAYNKAVMGEALGTPTKSGQTCREWFIATATPDARQLAHFDAEVKSFKRENFR